MSFSISNSVPFSNINWDSFENRPTINKSMLFCTEKNWYDDVKCCMDGYSIEHIRDVAYEHGLEDTPEVRFLDQYPCINGLESDYFVDRIESMPSKKLPEPTESQFPNFECLSKAVFDGLSRVLPTPLLESIRPYLCRE